MCERLKKELPTLGCQLITPPDACSSIVVVQAKDLAATGKDCEEPISK
jgi:hypothetical protein